MSRRYTPSCSMLYLESVSDLYRDGNGDADRTETDDGNRDADGFAFDRTRVQGTGSVPGWPALRGRPSGRTVCSKPSSLTVRRTHSSPPKGHPLSMLWRTRFNSSAESGAFTLAVQFVGLSNGHADSNVLISSSPCNRDHKLHQRRSCARNCFLI
jgi:hypothetical protein